MKQILLHFLVIFITTTNVFSQSPVVESIINQTNLDSLIFFVEELSGEVQTIIGGTPYTIVSRNKNEPSNDKAADYIEQKLEYYGLDVYNQSFSSSGRNVYGVLPGTEFPNQSWMICAHYDDMPYGSTAPGADDNASGTAAVLEAARILSQESFPYTIIFALWDEEEQGLVGSNYYANLASANGDSILGVINLDMIAWDSDIDDVAEIHTRSVGNSYDIKDKMVEVNSVYNIDLTLQIDDPGTTASDHASFWSNGYGAILLIEDFQDFNAYYHTTSDLVTHYNQPYYHLMTKLAIGTLATFALNLDLKIIHTSIASRDNTNDIETSAEIITGLDIGTGQNAPRLYYRTDTGTGWSEFYQVVGILSEASGTYNFTIPGQSLGTIVQYYLAAQDENSSIVTTLPVGGGGFSPPGSIAPGSFFQFFVASQVIALYDEANNLNDWTSSGGWDITTSQYVSPPTSFTDSPSGNYSNNVTSSLKYNDQISLIDVLGATLEYDTQWDIENDWDYGQVQISTNSGSTWTALEGLYTNPGTGSFQPSGEPLYDGSQLSWVHEYIDISTYVNQYISLRFLLKTDESVPEDGWYVDNIKISTFNSTSTFSLSVPVADGWNMVSVPGLHPTNQNVDTWWSGKEPGASVFKYAGGYTAVTTATPTEGYWMKNVGGQVYSYPAIEIVTHNDISAAAGWNMIGGYENTVPVGSIVTIPPGQITGSIFEYSGGYVPATNIVPGYGYWVKLLTAGLIGGLSAPPAGKHSVEVVEYFKEDWGKIIITDNAGVSYILYAVKGEVDLDNYELPPAPPAGMFDIRYSSGRIAEDINSTIQTIEMNSLAYPITVSVEGMDIRLQDESGNEINENVKSGDRITISNQQINKLMVSGELIPDVYALEQNYPNPFNPSTVIEFSLPENVSNVQLTIYDVLGQKITQLVNTSLKAGKYRYQWDAGNVASGMYIYELRTNKFVSIKKMMFTK